MSDTILFIMDDVQATDGTETLLRTEGFQIAHTYYSDLFLSDKNFLNLQKLTPQTVVLVYNTEGKNSFQKMKFVQMLSELHGIFHAPIVVIARGSSETDRILMLNGGACDVCDADMVPMEVAARIKAHRNTYLHICKWADSPENIYRVGDLVVDDAKKAVEVGGEIVKLTPLEYKILKLLVQERGKVLSSEQIYENIWQMEAYEPENTIAVHIRHIRQKIEKDPKEPRYLQVVWGCGYKVG